jgi:hypothetical protein
LFGTNARVGRFCLEPWRAMMPDDLLSMDEATQPPPCKHCGEPMKLMRTIADGDTEKRDYECLRCNIVEVDERQADKPFVPPE